MPKQESPHENLALFGNTFAGRSTTAQFWSLGLCKLHLGPYLAWAVDGKPVFFFFLGGAILVLSLVLFAARHARRLLYA